MRATAQELEQVMRVARRSRQVLLATVNEAGEPSFTPVQECRLTDETSISIKTWTGIPPLEHRDGQARMALLIWDSREGHVYRLAGQAVRSQTSAMFSSYADLEEQDHLPVSLREILMEVDSIEELQFGRKESWQT